MPEKKNGLNKVEYRDCWLWLYIGAWQEWNIEEFEMAIPMSPDQDLGLTRYAAMEASVRRHYEWNS